MTATTMDTLDAQMADYQNDFDVPMHISSSDTWLQDVAPMEDDVQLAFQSKLGTTDASSTIEVDMEAYIDDGHAEYDMVDDHPGHNLTTGELLDVDVLPASTMQSPFVAVTTLPPVEYPPPSVSTPHLNPAPLVSEGTTEPSTNIEPKLVDPNTTSDSQDNTPSPEVEQRLDRISTPEDVVSHEPQNTEHIAIPTTSFEVPLDQAGILHATNSTMLGFHSETDETASHNLVVLSEKDFQGGPSHLRSEPGVTGPDSAGNADMQASHNPLTISHMLPRQIHERISGVPDSESYVDDAEPFIAQDSLSKPTLPEAAGEIFVEEKPPSPQEEEIPVLRSAEESADTSNEPPEEAYLEVPPPILLAIFSNDQPELCLFNKPSESLPNEDDPYERHILLQTLPSLYYEPLVHVFEALRQDEYISTVLEVPGNELALEAYDLDLAITEDNFHAREISLHDFHFLHTSANIAGSLRLRLYISGPRFFVRYHALQGLLNLHLDDPKDVEHSEIEKPLGEHEDKELYVQEGASAAEDASTSERRRFGPPRGIPHPLEEGGHERVDGHHEASHTASEGTVTEPGEIDLSTLPPFIDSPEENAEQQGEYSGEALYHTTTTPDNASTGDNYTQDDEQRSEEQANKEQENDEQGTEEQEDDEQETEGQENDEQENEEQENEERGNHEEQESNQPTHKEEPDSTGVKSAAVIPVDTVQNEENENGPFEENVADGPRTPDRIEGGEDRECSTASPREHTENLHQPEQNKGDQYEYLPVEFTDKIQHREGNTEDIPFGISVDAYQEAEAIADVKDVEGLDETWDDELDGEGDPDTTWEPEPENLDESISNESSVTLSSKASKRSFNESGLEHSDEENCSSESPGAKRVRVA